MSIQTKITEICQQYAKEQQGKQEIDYRALADLNRNISDLQVEFSMENIMKQFAVFERSHRMQMAAIEKAHNSQMDSLKESISTIRWISGLIFVLLGIILTVLFALLTK